MKTTNSLKPAWRALFTGLIGSLALAHHGLAAMPNAPVTTPAQTSASAGGNSYAPVFSLDGHYLAFVSHANNLVTNDDLGLSLDVFVRDLTNQTTTLVSVNTNGIGGGDFDANYPSISSNGQWIAFASAASNLVSNDTNELSDVFVRDMVAGTTRLVSVDTAGSGSANGKSSAPQISADGRWIFFESTATNLVSGQFPTNLLQVYARDLQAGATYLVLPHEVIASTTNLNTDNFAVTADGRWLAFASPAPNLVVYAVTNQGGDIYVRNVQAGINAWASSQVGAFFVDFTNGYRCFHPVLSSDGAQVAFKATAGGINQALVFWTELDSGNTFCVASNSLDTSWPELSADGRFLAYEDGTNVFVWDRQQQTNRLINVGYDGLNPGNGPAKTPVLSADGRTVAFLSAATDLVAANAPGSNAVFQLFVRSLESNITWLVSANLQGAASSDSLETGLPAVSPNGRQVAFESADDQIVAQDQNRASDIFLRDLDAGTTALISVRADSRASRTGIGNCFVNPLCISTNGQYALIASFDNSLSAADTNGVTDFYLVDLVAGTNVFINVPTNSINPNPQSLFFPALSAEGNSVAFIRKNPYTPQEGFVFDRGAGSLGWFNLNPTGGVVTAAFGDVSFDWTMSLSPDGRWLAFCAAGAELVQGMIASGNQNIFLRDLVAGTNMLVTHSFLNQLQGGNGDSVAPRFSPDGRWLIFSSRAANLFSGNVSVQKLFAIDLQNDTLRGISHWSPATGAVASASGQYVAFCQAAQYNSQVLEVYRHDLFIINQPILSPTNVLVATNARNPSISSNGQWIAFQSYSTNNPIADIYVKDLETGSLELTSMALAGGGGNGSSFNPQITADGRYVLFASRASNLVPNDTNGCSDVFLRDRQLGFTYLLSANPKTGRSGNRPSTSPLLSSDGSTIIFASLANDLAEADYNDKQDIFVVKLARGDSDADGLDDTWEMAYFGNLAQGGTGDADGDGLKDREEFRAGTDPTNQGSVLRALAVAPVGGQSTTLMWPAALGRQYQIQFKRSVTDTNWTVLPATITVTGNAASATDTQAGLDAARFYRILILP